jgi:hypothetical protein
MSRGKMKAPTKAELRDRIIQLENNELARRGQIMQLENHVIGELHTKLLRSNIAAYALLVTLFIIVGVEVIW